MKYIQLSQGLRGRPPKDNHRGFVAIVDDDDYDMLSQWHWTAIQTERHNGGYACRGESGKSIFMHRLIMNCPEGMQVDHINGNGLDNRRENLRVVTSKENRANRRINLNNKSGYKGVHFNKQTRKWRMQIAADFDTPEEAAKAFDICASTLHGEYASLNFGVG